MRLLKFVFGFLASLPLVLAQEAIPSLEFEVSMGNLVAIIAIVIVVILLLIYLILQSRLKQ